MIHKEESNKKSFERGPVPWNKGKNSKRIFVCQICNKEFERYESRGGTVCDIKCRSIIAHQKRKERGWKHSEETKKNLSLSHMGVKFSEERRQKMCGKIPWNKGLKGFMEGEQHPRWSETPSYRTLHLWVERKLGKPNQCSHCKESGENHQMHWANKSQTYKREITDWLRLCAKCHKAYDQKQLALS